MGQLCSCARSQDKRGRKWVNKTILSRSPSTTSSNYGPNFNIKQTPDGQLQRILHSPGGVRQTPSAQENQMSRSHPNQLEASGICGKYSPDGYTTGSFEVINSGRHGLAQTSAINGPINSGILQKQDKEISLTRSTPSKLEKSSSAFEVSPIHRRMTPDLDLKLSESAQSDFADSVTSNDVTVKVIPPLNDHLEGQAQKVRSVLQRTVELLASEIDGSTLVEFLQRSRPGKEVTNADWTRCCNPSGAQDIFWDIIAGQQDDDYAIFCQIIASKAHFQHLIDLLQTLDSVIALVTPDLDDDDDNNDGSHDDSWSRDELDRLSGCQSCVESSDFDLDLIFCHRETIFGSAPTPVGSSAREENRSPVPTHFDCSNLSLAGGSYLPSITSEELGQPTVPMITLSLINYCLCRRQKAKILHRILEESSCIRELSLVKTHLDNDDLKLLLQLAKKNTSVLRLDLRLSCVDNDAAGHLGQTLQQNSSLRFLNVASTGLSDIGCSRLMSGLTRNRALSDLDIGFNDIRDTGCCSVAETLVRASPLRKLRMRDNGITCYGACALFQSLARNCRLVFLDISSNGIGDDSLRHLSEALISNRTLRELNLENCRISVGGCAALARALRANTALRCLQLSQNPITDAGLEVLADGLRYNHAVETLAVNMCNVGNVGFLRLLDALRFNFTLKTVKLCYNSIGAGSSIRNGDVTSALAFMDEIYARLYEVLHYNPKLKVLMWGNDLERIEAATGSNSIDPQLNQHLSYFSKASSYSPIMDLYRQDVLVST